MAYIVLALSKGEFYKAFSGDVTKRKRNPISGIQNFIMLHQRMTIIPKIRGEEVIMGFEKQ